MKENRMEIEVDTTQIKKIIKELNSPYMQSIAKKAMRCTGEKVKLQIRGVDVSSYKCKKTMLEKVNTEC